MTLSYFQLFGLLVVISSGVAAALVFGPLAIWIAKRTGLVDVPGAAAHKHHARPTPLAGGIALALSILALLTIFHLWQSPFSNLLAGAAIVFLFGIWDDAKGLSAPQKAIGQVLASVVLIASGIYVKFVGGLSIPFLSPGLIMVLNWIITIFWLVGVSNAINLIDSMDGLALGVTGIAFTFFMGMTLAAQQSTLAQFCGMFLGVCIGLYIYNISPARLFLGDSGAQTLGFVLAGVAILYTPFDLPQASSWFVPIMVLGIPIFDTTLVVVSRLRHRRPVFQADRSHIYHRLVSLGLDPGRAVLVVHILSLSLNFLAFIALYLVPWQANLVFGLVVMAGIALLVLFERKFQIPGDIHG
jgi:UDP-GlcNAc:undecaprenyl-phosphate/decaprenyl-phosphate GlcNAc-1-phosphate transferase